MEDPMSLLPEEDEMSDELIEKGTEAVFQLGLRLNREEARAVFVAALAAIEASGTHRLVPVNPTLEMGDAGFDAVRTRLEDDRTVSEKVIQAYLAMLSAAPKLGERHRT